MTSEPQDQMDEETMTKNYLKLLQDGKKRVFVLLSIALTAKVKK